MIVDEKVEVECVPFLAKHATSRKTIEMHRHVHICVWAQLFFNNDNTICGDMHAVINVERDGGDDFTDKGDPIQTPWLETVARDCSLGDSSFQTSVWFAGS